MTETNTDTSEDKYMSLTEFEALNDSNDVGLLLEWERGPNTIEYHDVGPQIARRLNDSVGEEDSTLFFSSDGGELDIGYDPMFDAPIVTNAKKEQIELALKTLREETHYGDITIIFDDAGPIIFKSDDVLTVTTPMKFPWQHGSEPKQTRSPCTPNLNISSETE